MVSYKTEAMMDPRAGYWFLACTEFVEKRVVFKLMDVYANFRLWYFEPDVIAFML